MTKKILFWVDWGIWYYGLAKALQENYDYKIYSIIDINNTTREFFKKQNLVKFEKTWFYRDLIKPTKKIDVKYLKNIEEKYKINLWKNILTDRRLYQYNEYYRFSKNEVLSIIEQECKLYEEVINSIKPDYLFIKTTDQNRNNLLYQLCKANGVKILMMNLTRFGYRMEISDDFDKMVKFNLDSKQNRKTIEEIKNYMEKYNTHKQFSYRPDLEFSINKKILLGLYFILNICNSEYRKYWGNYGRTRLNVLKNEVRLIKK